MISIAEVFEDHKKKNINASTNANEGPSRSSGLYLSQRPPIF